MVMQRNSQEPDILIIVSDQHNASVSIPEYVRFIEEKDAGKAGFQAIVK